MNKFKHFMIVCRNARVSCIFRFFFLTLTGFKFSIFFNYNFQNFHLLILFILQAFIIVITSKHSEYSYLLFIIICCCFPVLKLHYNSCKIMIVFFILFLIIIFFFLLLFIIFFFCFNVLNSCAIISLLKESDKESEQQSECIVCLCHDNISTAFVCICF